MSSLVSLVFLVLSSALLSSALLLLIKRGSSLFTEFSFLNEGIILISLSVLGFFQFYFSEKVKESAIADIRVRVFHHLLTLSSDFSEEERNFEKLISKLHSFLDSLTTTILQGFLFLGGGMLMMFLLSPKLTIYVLAGLILALSFFIFLRKAFSFPLQKAHNSLESLRTYEDDRLEKIRTIQALTCEHHEGLIFEGHTRELLSSTLVCKRVEGLIGLLVFLFSFAILIGIIGLGKQEVLSGRMTEGDSSIFFIYGIIVSGAFIRIFQSRKGGNPGKKAAETLSHILTNITTDSFNATRSLPQRSRGTVAIHSISFTDPLHPDRFILDKFTLSVAPGETLAIVGPPHPGKDILFPLLLRFYNPQAGSIYIDGVDIRDVSVFDLRRRIGVLTCDPVVLFSATIYENILYGNPRASENDVWKAVEESGLSLFLDRFPQGIHTLVEKKEALRLSEEQKAKIELARVILKNPSFLLVEESPIRRGRNTAEDQEMKNLMMTRTTITLAHQLTTVLRADRIVVMEEGKVQAIGSHAELVTENDLYRRLMVSHFSNTSDSIFQARHAEGIF